MLGLRRLAAGITEAHRMKPLRIEKGRYTLLLDRNRDEGFVRMADMAMFLNADDLADLGAHATALSKILKREAAYALARIAP